MAASTVFFATNRIVSGDATDPDSYGAGIVAPSDPAALTYGQAFVDGIDLATNGQGRIAQLAEVSTGDFSAAIQEDIGQGGRNICVFVHGFDNSFSDAVTRAGFNREFLRASGQPYADMTMIAFSWPSLGKVIDGPNLLDAYRSDQTMALNSAFHLMTFFSRLQPVLDLARATGHRTVLLAHSMGNLATRGAVESWFLHGNGPARLFDAAALAAGDTDFTDFAYPPGQRLSSLHQLCARINVLFSHTDGVINLSNSINRMQRLGWDGPQNRGDAALFPPSVYADLDCTGINDFPGALSLLESHQYYRRSPSVRARLAAALCA